MNPIWLSAIIGAVLGRQRAKRPDGSAPEDRCSPRQSSRTPLKSLMAFLRRRVKRVPGSEGRQRLAPRTKQRMKCPHCGAATLDERIHEGTVSQVCENCQGTWPDGASPEHRSTDTTGKSGDCG